MQVRVLPGSCCTCFQHALSFYFKDLNPKPLVQWAGDCRCLCAAAAHTSLLLAGNTCAQLAAARAPSRNTRLGHSFFAVLPAAPKSGAAVGRGKGGRLHRRAVRAGAQTDRQTGNGQTASSAFLSLCGHPPWERQSQHPAREGATRHEVLVKPSEKKARRGPPRTHF